jgi:cytochrome c peroxidase
MFLTPTLRNDVGHANGDEPDAPFEGKFGDKPAMTDQDVQDVIVFMKNLSDEHKA